MKITVIGRGNVGGGLARRWERAGHEINAIGRDGGNASDADVVVLAVPGGEIADALAKVSGLDGKTTIDATNTFGERNGQFDSLAAEVKSTVGGPTAKSFNCNFARLYDEIDGQRVPPGNLFACDDEAREVTEQLIRDAGFEPIYAGGLENARLLEDHLTLMSAIVNGGMGRFFYRDAPPGEL